MTEAVNKTYKNLNQKLLPISSYAFKKLANAYEQDRNDYINLEKTIDGVLNDFKEEIMEASNNMNEIIKKSGRDEQVKKKGDTFLTAKHDQIKTKGKNTESIISGLKEAVSKIKPHELAELPVDKERCLNNFFKMMYDVLYKESKEFTWKEFKKLALLHQKGEDFQSRMANINVYTLNQNQFKEILKVQEDPEFQKFCEDPKFGQKMLDVGDWLQYVKAGYQFGQQKVQVQKQHDKIKKDIVKREVDIKEREERLKFWKETSSTLEEFQNNLQQIESRLKSIRIGVTSSIPKLKQHLTEAQKKAAQINNA